MSKAFDIILDGAPVVAFENDNGFDVYFEGGVLLDQGQPFTSLLTRMKAAGFLSASISSSTQLGLRFNGWSMLTAEMLGDAGLSASARADASLDAILSAYAGAKADVKSASRIVARLGQVVSLTANVFGFSSSDAGEGGGIEEALAASWPDALPYPLQEHGHDFDPRNLRTQMDSGRLRNRRMFPDLLETMRVKWNFTEDQYDYFEGFFLATLENGSLPFLLIDEDRELEVAFLNATYSFARSDNCFMVEAELEVIDAEAFAEPETLVHAALNAQGAEMIFEAGDVTVETSSSLPPVSDLVAWYKADGMLGIWEEGNLPFVILGPGQQNNITPPMTDFSGDHPIQRTGNPVHTDGIQFQLNVLNGQPALIWTQYIYNGTLLTGGNEANFIDTLAWGLGNGGPSVATTGFTVALVVMRDLDPFLTPEFEDIALAAAYGGYFSGLRSSIWGDIGDGLTVKYRGYGHATGTPDISVPLGSWQIVTLTFDNVEAVPRLYTNDDVSVGAYGPASFGQSQQIDEALFQNCYRGGAAELLIYKSKLSNSDLADLRAYLSFKYGIAITV